jgi:hypothetical protein
MLSSLHTDMLTLGARQMARRAGASRAGAVRLYHENIVEHYENPRNVGSMNKADHDVGTGLVGAPACGDVMKLQIKVSALFFE